MSVAIHYELLLHMNVIIYCYWSYLSPSFPACNEPDRSGIAELLKIGVEIKVWGIEVNVKIMFSDDVLNSVRL